MARITLNGIPHDVATELKSSLFLKLREQLGLTGGAAPARTAPTASPDDSERAPEVTPEAPGDAA